jgi:hypothetical protein
MDDSEYFKNNVLTELLYKTRWIGDNLKDNSTGIDKQKVWEMNVRNV